VACNIWNGREYLVKLGEIICILQRPMTRALKVTVMNIDLIYAREVAVEAAPFTRF